MSRAIDERLYRLLPAIYRIHDAERNEPLRALLALIETEFQALEDDIGGLYENWFIETCGDWMVPYIGDLLGVRLLHTVQSAGLYSLRPYVANTLAYRRRKGTASVLEQLARDVTGWPARAVEFFERLCTTQHLNHVRLSNVCTLDLRAPDPLELLHGPFEQAAHTAEVRHIDNGRGRYNIPDVGLFLWRLYAYPVRRSAARCIGDPADGCYTFSPLGYDAPLFNRPQTETEIVHLAGEINAPVALRRRALFDELEARRQATVDGEKSPRVYFGERPVFEIFVDGAQDPIPPDEIVICDLSDWGRPAQTKTYVPSGDPHCFENPACTQDLTLAVAVDPQLGRMTFPAGQEPGEVRVSYAYGFSSDVGGGPYNRRESVARWLDPRERPVTWQLGVTQDPQTLADAPDPAQLVQKLEDAIDAWNTQVANNPATFGVIAVMDSSTYEGDLTGSHAIDIPAGSRLAIVAADWPAVGVTGVPGQKQRVVGQFSPYGVRPHVYGDVDVRGSAAGSDTNPGELALDGLLVEGDLTVLAGHLGSLKLYHTTVAPQAGGLKVDATAAQKNDRLAVHLWRVICGPITLANTVPDLTVAESVVDSDGIAIDAAHCDVQVEASTVLGSSKVRSLEASNSIFTGKVLVERRQVGCVRFCYVTEDSHRPRRYRCQPSLALAEYAQQIGKASAENLTAAERKFVVARVRPRFTSFRYGDPGYAQLGLACAKEICHGAHDGAEMGVFCHLQQPQREANLRAALDEYLRFGLEAGLIYVT